jgi:peptidoglycan/LPS O-acetylase OafA/YrhL
LHILPPLYVYCIIALIALTTPFYHLRIVWSEAVCCLLGVANYYHGLHGHPYTVFSHTWFLGVEEQFYFLWPCVFVLFRRRLKNLTGLLLVVIPVIWIYRAYLGLSHVSDAYIYTSFETRADAILVGCWFALCIHTGIAKRLIQNISSPRYLVFTLLAIAASVWVNEHIEHPYRDLASFTLDPLLAAALILQLITLKGGAWMDGRVISYLGKISYSTYLYQQLVIPIMHHVLSKQAHILFSIMALFCAWGVAACSFEMIEKPFLRMKKRFSSTIGAPQAMSH